ncbi:MAG: Gfo/Idh/MocA family oxidoreductase [Planctomycetota bacterium]|jgi:predicted dehydrogenase|nr:Gfo/Idh/MocA family oxidoreductase [Planctomycetota bacterium]MDP7248554.1 Gfo/Idh/MocA family oxidoreductase [Planctomycetota bacterium]
MSDTTLKRRNFLSTAFTASSFYIVPRHVLGGPNHTAPSEVITRAVIGTGSMGRNHIRQNKEGSAPQTLAVCDVDKNHLAQGLKKAGPGCEPYSDFREVLERKDIDVVHVGTPPHWHALISIAACQAGKDVYSEKPMTRFIAEGRAVINAVRRYGRIFSINNYGRGGFERYRKLVQSGLLGSPLTVRMNPKTGYSFKVKQWRGQHNVSPQKVPGELDYDMWLGPAPFKPYFAHRVHRSFRGYWDYDGGGLADMGQHWIDPIQYLLGKDETGPAEIEAYAPWPAHPDACGMWGRLTLTYENGDRIILESHEWGDYDKEPQPFLEGPKGKVFHRSGRGTDPDDLWSQLKAYPNPPRLISFDEALKKRIDPSRRPRVEHAHRSISLIHLCNIAIRTGRKLQWDPMKEEFMGDPEANRLVNVPMRAPWHL